MGFGTIVVLLGLAVWLARRFWLGYRRAEGGVVRLARGSESSAVVTLGTGLLRGLVKRQGVLAGEVPSTRIVLEDAPSASRLTAYTRATVLADGKAASSQQQVTVVPLCFPQVLTVRVAAGLIVSRGFPLSPMGILHISQTVRQTRAMPAGTALEVHTFFAPYSGGLLFSETDKGIEMTLRVQVRLPGDTKEAAPVWQGDTVILSRSPAPARRTGPPPVFESPSWDYQSRHVVAATTGLSYAAVSGDYNPHHLFWWSALPMGFSRPIAHGMWSLAASLNELTALGVVREGVFPLTVRCEFKKPLLMPATVTFGHRKLPMGETQFGIYDKNNVDPHVIGTVSQGELLPK